jgi:hypothetical protein
MSAARTKVPVDPKSPAAKPVSTAPAPHHATPAGAADLPLTGFGTAALTLNPLAAAFEYMADLSQRTVLFWDVMRQRGNGYREHMAKTAPNVLDYQAELIIDGRTLERPVNYGLVRIVPPEGVTIDPKLRPFVIVDPRAGHGPGIGGFKADSEIGVALRAGHTCYFVGFLPDPMPGQTIEDIAHAEAVFLKAVIDRHPDVDGKPCVIGNCQAGWAVMMLAAVAPELFGPIIIAGSPLSYWTGQSGLNPMRYSGGLLGGSWLTAFTSDIGHGRFDGAWLVQNFENLNPANTLWTKQYNLFSKVDTEAPHYLGFERWWGGHVNLNAGEIQFIVDELFVGNKLAAGEIKTSNGTAIDLRNIRSPIVVFCSRGDNITPPQQALGWILDLYDSVDEMRCYGQTIVYAVHESVGHLGIFVSGGVARKQHGEFASNIDLIDVLPPGLYEAVFEPRSADMASADLALGDWIMSCEARTLDDIRALGGNDAADDRRFAAVARMSEANLALYRTFAQPFVRAAVKAPVADLIYRFHPLRMQYELMSDANPMARLLAPAADWVREHRTPAGKDNPFLAMQEVMSQQIIASLNAWRDMRDSFSETLFRTVYGLPAVQAMYGPAVRPSAAQGGQERALSRAGGAADCGAEVAHRQGRAARGGDPSAALYRHAARLGRRARLRDGATHPPRASRHADPAAAGFQGAGARAVLHAADRSRRRHRRAAPAAAGRCKRPHQGDGDDTADTRCHGQGQRRVRPAAAAHRPHLRRWRPHAARGGVGEGKAASQERVISRASDLASGQVRRVQGGECHDRNRRCNRHGRGSA